MLHNGWEAERSGKVSIEELLWLNFCSALTEGPFILTGKEIEGIPFNCWCKVCFFIFKAIKVKKVYLPPRNISFPLLKRDVSRCARDDFTHKLTKRRKKNRLIFIFQGEQKVVVHPGQKFTL